MNSCPACGKSIKPREIRGQAQKKVTGFLAKKGAQTICLTTGQIGYRLGLHSTTVSTVLRRLEAAGRIAWRRGRQGHVKPEITLLRGIR